MKKKGGAFAAIVLTWLVLVLVLTAVEANIPGSAIRSPGDALWYSLATLSTVGYGDVVPQSGLGRVVGSIFVLLGTCSFALLVSTAIWVLSGRLLAPLRIRLSRKKNRYIFKEWNRQSALLAKNILREEPDALIIGLQAPGKAAQGLAAVTLDAPPERAVSIASRAEGKAFLFLMDESQAANIEAAQRASALNVPVYCRTQDGIPWRYPNVVFFNPLQCCAQRYWQEHPVLTEKERIVLIGGGKLCAHLLEQALLVNVLCETQELVYHVTGTLTEFVSEHPQLGQICAIDGEQPGKDAVYFHGARWSELKGILWEADRIIVCEDDDAENLTIFAALSKGFATRAQVHVKLNVSGNAEQFFGCEEELYTPQVIMRQRLSELARRMDALYCARTGYKAKPWEEMSEFAQATNLAAADHLFTKIHLLLPDERFSELTPELCRRAYEAYLEKRQTHAEQLRRIEHERWMRFYELRNWTYAAKRDNEARRHPLLCRFESLPPEEQEKDDFAWEILGEIADDGLRVHP